MKRKDVKLYGAFLPFYGILVARYGDILWMVLANLALLALIAFLTLRLTRTPELKETFPKVFGRAVGASLAADAAATVFRFLPTLAELALRLFGAERAALYLEKYWSDFTWYEIWAWGNPIGLPWTVGSIVVGGATAFALNYFVLLKKPVPDKKVRLLLSALLGFFSAPWSLTNPAW